MIVALIVLAAVGALAYFIVSTLPKHAPKGGTKLTPPPVGDVLKTPTVSGTVTKVDSDSITFQVTMLAASNGLKPDVSTRTAHVTDKTVITLLVERSPQEYSEMQKAYAEAIKKADPKNPPVPPFPFSQKDVSLSAIHVGDAVIVTSKDNADISQSMSFDAANITIKRADLPPQTPTNP